MSIFDSLKSYIGRDSGAIRLLPVETNDVEAAESELGFLLPSRLKDFYRQIGYGWIGSDAKPSLRNLIIHPLDIVDLYNGVSEFSPPEGFLEGDLPVFDCGGNRFLVMRPESGSQRIYRDDGESFAIAEDFGDFINKVLADPLFYE